MTDAPKRILLVEDEPAIARAMSDKLTTEGFSVTRARDGEEGLLIATKEHPDLILLDVVMPKMDGMTMLLALRKDEWGKSAKVIFLTNLSEMDAVQKATELGVFDYIVKSDWKLADVVKKVREQIAAIGGTQQPPQHPGQPTQPPQPPAPAQ
jgi:DNA-binding response OmpR family regulator